MHLCSYSKNFVKNPLAIGKVYSCVEYFIFVVSKFQFSQWVQQKMYEIEEGLQTMHTLEGTLYTD